MKKLLFVCDGGNFPKGAMEFIKFLHQSETLLVKAVFLTPVDFQELIATSYVPIAEPYVKLKEEERLLTLQSRNSFISECEASSIKYQISHQNRKWGKDLFSRESRFSDLIVISEELFCVDVPNYTYQPNMYMRELLHKAECPVIAVPESFRSFERLVVAYDGKKESMMALKQFCYLFPQFTEFPAEFVYVKDEDIDDIPSDELLKEYLRVHFNSTAISKLHFDPKKYFTAWADSKKDILFIAGSFGRSIVSDIIKSSFAEQIINDHAFPIFIAHHS